MQGKRRRHVARSASAVLLAGLIAGTAAPVEAAQAADLRVEFRHGLLTVAARDAPVGAVLEAVGNAAGFEIRPVVETSATFTGDFASLPLADGLGRLLRTWSFALHYDDAGNPDLLVLLPPGRYGAEAPRAAAAPAAPAEAAQASPAQEERWIERRLASPDLGTRIVAVRRLDRLPAERATSLGLRILGAEPEPIVRAELAEALGRVEGDRVVAALEQLLDDRNASVQSAAVQALGNVGSDAAVDGLGKALLHGHEPALRQAALEALASHPGDTARDYLRRAAAVKGDPVAEAARRSLDGEAELGAVEDLDGAVPCLHAAGRPAGYCRER